MRLFVGQLQYDKELEGKNWRITVLLMNWKILWEMVGAYTKGNLSTTKDMRLNYSFLPYRLWTRKFQGKLIVKRVDEIIDNKNMNEIKEKPRQGRKDK